MPSLNFVLPNWLYWAGLLIFPLVAKYFVARQKRLGPPKGPSLFIAYMFWLWSGFIGIHRFYLKSLWGAVFIPVFLAIIFSNATIRDAREDVSRTRAAYEAAETAVKRASPGGSEVAQPSAQALAQAETTLKARGAEAQAAVDGLVLRNRINLGLALLMAAMLLGDALLLPGLVRRTREREAGEEPRAEAPHIPPVHEAGTGEDPTLGLRNPVTDAIEKINLAVGEYSAYWAVIAVFVYYYEVLARYVFDSPTNWVHESMFLMFGMQYMLSGAFAYREDQHVRVDVVYTKFSPRGKAFADITSSIFFFIFIITMLWTGTRFAWDAASVNEHSFTEWGIEYWPVKMMIPFGAALMALQGVAKLIKDIILVTRRGA